MRERILEATLGLLRREGIGAVTASAVARAAGIQQPNFYAHFHDIDACLTAAAEHLVAEFAAYDVEAFRALRRAVESGQDHRALNLRYHEDLVEVLLRERHVSELYFRHRHGSSAFARALRRFDREATARTFEHLWEWAMRVGVSPRRVEDVQLLAEIHVGNVASILLALIEGRASDPRRAAHMLADLAEATTIATFRRLLQEEGTTVPRVLRAND